MHRPNRHTSLCFKYTSPIIIHVQSDPRQDSTFRACTRHHRRAGPRIEIYAHPCPGYLMDAWPVTRLVNKRGFESPHCTEPIAPKQGELNL